MIYNDVEENTDTIIKSPAVRSVENFVNHTPPDYLITEDNYRGTRKEYRQRRRKSRELPDTEFKNITPITITTETEDDNKRKPEAMRSISEDSGVKPIAKPLTRRSLSHPEKDSQV